MLFAELNLPEGNDLLIYGGAAGGGLVVLVMICLVFFRGKKKEPIDPEAGLSEDLSAYPPAPSGKRHYQLSVMNYHVRLRLVAVAPVGKRPVGKVDSVLEQVLRGLGEVSLDDKPRLRVWPPQLSLKGFAPTFFRLTKRPDPDGKPSRWVLLAGPAKAGGVPVLLALACVTDQPTTMGLVTVTSESQWNELLRVEHA
jgi:hypothetical protein